MRRLLLKTAYLFLATVFVSLSVNAQVTTDPTKIDVLTKNAKIIIDVSGTPVAAFDDLYLWGWSTGAGDFVTNGTWEASSEEAKLTKESDNTFSFTFPISFDGKTYENLAEILNSSDNPTAIQAIGCLVKTKDGGQKTGDLKINIEPLAVSIAISKPLVTDLFIEGDKIDIEASSPSTSTLVIKVNDVEVATKEGTSITYSIASAQAGDLKIEVSASAGGLTDTKTLNFLVGKTVVKEDRPAYATLLGPNFNGNEVTLVLQDPNGKKQFVNVIGSFNDWGDKGAYPMKLEEDGDVNYWWYTFNTLDADTEYIYQYLIDGSLIIADPYTEKVSDPDDKWIDDVRYPNLIAYPEGKTRFRASSFIINQDEYTWKNTSFTPVAIEDAVVYELLFRDFTSEQTYDAAIEKLQYIKDLGANVIHVMPVNEFEGNSSWGYNPNFYFAPDKYYGPKNKLKEFIDDAHGKGLAVVIDLVLNHSFHSSPMVRMYNEGDYGDPTEDNPWFNTESNFTNPGLQWGADFDHESEFTKSLVDSVNAHWMKYYKVDGYRFDFTKGFGNNPKTGSDEWGSNYDQDRIDLLLRMNTEIKKRNPNALVIFEHLAENREEIELAKEGISMWGNMNHNFRDIVKGQNSDIRGQSPKDRGMPIHGLISYMESHDEERLIYESETNGTNSQEYDLKKIENGLDRAKLASAFFFMVPGPKLIWQFGERGYNVSINQKEYQGEVSGDHRTSEKPLIEEFDTQNDGIRKELYDVYAALLKLRHDYDLGSLADNDYSFDLTNDLKTISLNGASLKVKVIGNFTLNEVDYTYDYSSDSEKWYSYFNNGTETASSGTITLKPSEFILLTDKQVDVPVDGLVKGYTRLFKVTPYGFVEDEEIKVYFDPSATEDNFEGTITLEAGVVLDAYGSGNITNTNTITMTREGDKFVASFTPRSFFSLEESDAPYQMSLMATDGTHTTTTSFLSFVENNKSLYVVGDVLGIDWNPGNSIEMTPDEIGGFILVDVNLEKGQIFKLIDQKDWNGGQWGYASEGKLKESNGEGSNIPVNRTGKATIRANINNLTYSISYDITSIEDNELSKSVIASPNPTSSEVTLTSTSLKGDVEWIVRDQSGRVLQLGTQLQVNGQFKTDLSMFPAGIYFVELFTSEGRVVKKVIRR
ncbi:T9SS type A sorting domain-containing protein [Flammeovirga sp. MY04]|uniref:alpha-amylase family glycosyl hydrolase n=1 Tax=Flammeovirga sp. MY04 TaxID=1191459 RepID=UPI00080632EE|nr:alpha-amylase family glycosyl hydrolase [Flammeovirga sp. MY04]ANQ47999.1 T9SS type A sorting domain-containing protein [Flammeovirga sp. MY04]